MGQEALGRSRKRLRGERIGAVFADLFLPDSRGIETLDKLLVAAPQVPIVVLCGVDDEDTALRSIQRGARETTC